jgi:hypothetical protein
MRFTRVTGALALAAVITVGASACSGGGAGSGSNEIGEAPSMSQKEIKATIPGLKADAKQAAEATLKTMESDDLPERSAFEEANPLDDHHYYGKWEAEKSDSGAGDVYNGQVCVEYRPSKDDKAVAFAMYQVSYIPAISDDIPAKPDVSYFGHGLNAGC